MSGFNVNIDEESLREAEKEKTDEEVRQIYFEKIEKVIEDIDNNYELSEKYGERRNGILKVSDKLIGTEKKYVAEVIVTLDDEYHHTTNPEIKIKFNKRADYESEEEIEEVAKTLEKIKERLDEKFDAVNIKLSTLYY